MKYVAEAGYTGTNYSQSVLWHYKTDIDRTVLNRWFVNIFDQGVLEYTPSAAGPAVSTVTIAAGTSFLIKEMAAVSPDVKIAKVDMILNHVISVGAYGDGTYALIAVWENAADEYRGVEFYLKTDPAEISLITDNYVRFGTVTIAGGFATVNDTTGITRASMSSGLLGYSGYSGSGPSGYSGTSGEAGQSGTSGYDASTSGYSGFSGYSAQTPGNDGASGYSGYSSNVPGIQGPSGYSGVSGLTGSECILLTCSDELTPLTTGTKVTFRMPYAMTLTKVKATLTTAGSTTTTPDVREEGTTIFGTSPSLATGVKTASVTSGTGLSDTYLADDAEITVLISAAGTGATGLKIYLIGSKA